MGSEDMARTLNRRATTSINSPEQRQPYLYYIREAVQASCHDFEESAKNHNDSTACLEEGRRHREQRVRVRSRMLGDHKVVQEEKEEKGPPIFPL